MLQRLIIVTTLAAAAGVAVLAEAGGGVVYPRTPKGDVVEELHGVKIADPYRWLEDLDSAATADWVKEQNQVTASYLAGIPERAAIAARLSELWNFERFSVPSKEGGRYFYQKNDGLQPQSVVYVADALDATPRILLNPNDWSKDGTMALAGLAVHENGKLAVYALAEAGSDWQQYRVRNVDTGEDLPDLVRWAKFSGPSWKKDASGFYYSRFDEPQSGAQVAVNQHHKVYFHRLGTPQAEDALVCETPDHPDWMFAAGVTDDGDYLMIDVEQGTERNNRIWYQDLRAKQPVIVKLLNDFDAQYRVVANDGPIFYVFTDNAAPRGRLIAVDTRKPERTNWKEIIPQAAEVLQGASLVGNQLFASYLKDAHTVIRTFDLAGKPIREVGLPGIGTAGGFGGRRADQETFYAFTSFNYPTTVFRYDIANGTSTVFRAPKVQCDPQLYETRQVFYPSKDGTQVPMFITHRKGLKCDGQNPTVLYGYGGFGMTETPGFSIARILWMDMGGILAVANLRGGGEYGDAWHDGGRLKNKQNVFDDFIAGAEWLIANQYTCPAKLAIQGGSNGGLLVGACMVQRPELFGACLPIVGVMDMLRYHKSTIGWAWASEFGSPDDPEYFPVILKYSPLHNIKAGTCYPPMLAMTADHDDRVVPWQTFKFVSAMQAAQGCENPILVRVQTRAGHGGGKPTQKVIDEVADQYAFLVRALKMSPKLPASNAQ